MGPPPNTRARDVPAPISALARLCNLWTSNWLAPALRSALSHVLEPSSVSWSLMISAHSCPPGSPRNAWPNLSMSSSASTAAVVGAPHAQ
eukprot:1519654-Prymnesium_polylepis.2